VFVTYFVSYGVFSLRFVIVTISSLGVLFISLCVTYVLRSLHILFFMFSVRYGLFSLRCVLVTVLFVTVCFR